jgi:transposase
VVDPVQEAAAALEAIVAEGVADGSISEAAAAEIRNGLDEALGSFGDGDTEEAIERLGELGAAIDELVDQEEIHHSQERKLDKAIEDLVGRMEPSEED